MISKELLSEVLGLYQVLEFEIDDGEVKFEYFEDEIDIALNEDGECGSKDRVINIYELAHKCKDWALDNGYSIEIGVHPIIKIDRNDREYFYTIKNNKGGYVLTSLLEDNIKTESEATFKACQWILENKE